MVTQSEYFESSDYIKNGLSLVGGFTSPEGLSNAYKLVDDATVGTHRFKKTYTVANNATLTQSVYAKAGERNWIFISSYDGTAGRGAYFDLTNGIKGTTIGGATSDIELLSNGYYRCSVTATIIGTSFEQSIYVAFADLVYSYTGDGTSGLFIYGLQLEAASYPTSYIPTNGVSQTRAAEDEVQVGNMLGSGVTTSGAWSLFFDISKEADNAYDGDNSIIVRLFNSSADLISVRKYYEGQEGRLRFYSNLDVQTISYLDTSNKKWCMVVDDKEIKLYSDGSLKHTANLPSSHNGLDDIVLQYGSFERTSTNYSSVLVFPTALTDSECIALTTI